MDRITAIRAGLAVIIFVMGSLQAWDSDVPDAGLLIVFLVSVTIALPAVALLVPLEQTYFLGASALSFWWSQPSLFLRSHCRGFSSFLCLR